MGWVPPTKKKFAWFFFQGFDVWLANSRGNIHSKKHQFHPTNTSQFWDFSLDEMSTYDLPAMINHVLKLTNQKQLFYIGCSQGSMVAFQGEMIS